MTDRLSATLIHILALLLSCGIATAQQDEPFAAGVYTIDPRLSDIRLLVYRGGLLGTFGHNHVISARGFTGTITLTRDLTASRLVLDVPVDKLVVDDTEVRRQEGKTFSGQPSEDDIAGTRKNMLGKRLLNAQRFPAIKITGQSGPVDQSNSAEISVNIELLGRNVQLSLPATLKRDGSRLVATGTYSLTHEQLGLKPFSALIGTLRVADNMDLKFEIHAEKQPQ